MGHFIMCSIFVFIQDCIPQYTLGHSDRIGMFSCDYLLIIVSALLVMFLLKGKNYCLVFNFPYTILLYMNAYKRKHFAKLLNS